MSDWRHSYDKFLADCAQRCRSCPGCMRLPCDACAAGGMCDEMCFCGEQDELDPLDRMDPDYCSDEEDML